MTARNGGLSFAVGPAGEQFPLVHYSGDDFYFETAGENGSGFSGAIFAGSPTRVTSLTVNAWNADKLGTFVRP